MLNMVKGCRVSDPSVLFEGYEQLDTGFFANVDADKMRCLFENFIRLHNEMCFVILEVPTGAKEEAALSSEGAAQRHKDVYYLDGLTPERAIEFLDVYGEWVLNDGLSSFGIGIHSGANELVLGMYNVVHLYTLDKKKYAGFFEGLGIPRTSDLKTAWDFFTRETPGDTFVHLHKGKHIYDIVEHLKQYGLYFAERREDNT